MKDALFFDTGWEAVRDTMDRDAKSAFWLGFVIGNFAFSLIIAAYRALQ